MLFQARFKIFKILFIKAPRTRTSLTVELEGKEEYGALTSDAHNFA